jgi:endonuclease/exonuclease/phosphatase family metal-dependent hydrolase
MHRVITCLTALGLLVLPSVTACTATTPPDPASTATTSTRTASTRTAITVLQLNICHGGMAGCYRGDAVLAKAAEVIESSRPQVLSVNEACSDDVDRLRPAMGPARALFVAARDLDGTPTLCRDSDRQYGNIVMVADALAGTTEETGTYPAQYTAADGHLELRSWACLPAGEVSACTTHLSSDSDPTALAQCQDLTGRAAGYPRPVIVAGDLNLDEQGSPRIQDCDPPGFTRHSDGSLQHVYASDDLTHAATTIIDMAGTTDHPGLLVTLTDPGTAP